MTLRSIRWKPNATYDDKIECLRIIGKRKIKAFGRRGRPIYTVWYATFWLVGQ